MKKIFTTIAMLAAIQTTKAQQASFTPSSNWTATSMWYMGNTTGTGGTAYWETIDDYNQGTLTFQGTNLGNGSNFTLPLSFAMEQGIGGQSKKSTLEIRVQGIKYVTLTTNDGTAAGNNVSVTYQNGATGPVSSLYIGSSGWSIFQDITFFIPRNNNTSATITIESKPTGSQTNAGDDWRVRLAMYPLAVKLVSFTGSEENGMVKLNWNTADERDFDRFEIESSMNGRDFQSIAAISGKGSNSQYEYRTLDNSRYFRLKMIDLDGSINYSKVVALYGKEIVNEDNQPTIMYDMSGRIVKEATQPGIYIIKTGNTVTKIMKQ